MTAACGCGEILDTEPRGAGVGIFGAACDVAAGMGAAGETFGAAGETFGAACNVAGDFGTGTGETFGAACDPDVADGIGITGGTLDAACNPGAADAA